MFNSNSHFYFYRHFVRKYQIPPNYKQENVTSTLSSDGLLTVSAVAPAIQQETQQEMRSVKIASVGPQKESLQDKY